VSAPAEHDAAGARVDCRAGVDALVRFYETLSPASLARIGEVYAADATFSDPFNAVRGTGAIARIFAHMFATVESPRIVVTARFVDAERAMLAWDFHLRLRGRDTVIHGATELRFDADGRVAAHRDHWDPAAGIYERLPLIGAPLRWLRARLAAR